MQSERLSFDTMDQQQAVFGAQDDFAKMIEKALGVRIGLKDYDVDVRGESEEQVRLATEVLRSLLQFYRRGEPLNESVVARLIDEAQEVPAGAVNPVQVSRCLLRVLQMPPGQFAGTKDRIERGAHIVGHAPEECLLGILILPGHL